MNIGFSVEITFKVFNNQFLGGIHKIFHSRTECIWPVDIGFPDHGLSRGLSSTSNKYK